MVGLLPSANGAIYHSPGQRPGYRRPVLLSPEGAVHRRKIGPGLQPSIHCDHLPGALPRAGMRPGLWPSRPARPPAIPRRWVCISGNGGSSWLAMGGDGANGTEGVARGESFLDEGEEATGRMAGNDIERNQHILIGADEVFVMGIEDAEVVLRAVVGGIGDFHESERGEPIIQQETQAICPLTEVFLLAGKSGRPRWASTCFMNSSEEIERREDKIRAIRSSLIRGRTGTCGVWFAFTDHDLNRGGGLGQAAFFVAGTAPKERRTPIRLAHGTPMKSGAPPHMGTSWAWAIRRSPLLEACAVISSALRSFSESDR